MGFQAPHTQNAMQQAQRSLAEVQSLAEQITDQRVNNMRNVQQLALQQAHAQLQQSVQNLQQTLQAANPLQKCVKMVVLARKITRK